ncbi:hypothetical protein ACFXPS_38545 [Nocardia sp. NPDC059091]|uniref:hypothetical protein n=1 Tax=unclassified Nocardia TaxID=2637762 RepID=UPI0036C1B394
MTAIDEGNAVLSFPFALRAGLDLEPECAWLRAESPVARVRLPHGTAWLVTRYVDVRAIMSDNRFSRAAACQPALLASPPCRRRTR